MTQPTSLGTVETLQQGAWCKSTGCAWLCLPKDLISICKYRSAYAGSVQAVHYFWSLLHWAKRSVPQWSMCLSLERKRLLRAWISFCWALSLLQPGPAQVSSRSGLSGSLTFPQWQFARVCWVWLPREWCQHLSSLPFWVCVFQQEVTKVCLVSLYRFIPFWHILDLDICPKLHQPFPYTARNHLFTYGEGTSILLS